MVKTTLIMLFFFSFCMFFMSTAMWLENLFEGYSKPIPDRLIRLGALYSILFSSVGIIFGMFFHD